jgi:hypothetical protein
VESVKTISGIILSGFLMLMLDCSPTVKVKHEVAPIYITVDVNIRVQKELKDFFDFEDEPQQQNN